MSFSYNLSGNESHHRILCIIMVFLLCAFMYYLPAITLGFTIGLCSYDCQRYKYLLQISVHL